MKRDRIYFGVLLLVLIMVIIWAAIGMLSVGKIEKTYSVSVIVDDSNNERWMPMREGLEQAASDYGIKLNYVSTGKFGSVEEEMILINREVENGADGIIVQMIESEGYSFNVESIHRDVAMMLLETDVMPQDVYAITQANNIGIGRALGEAVLADFGDKITGKKIGVLCGNQKQCSMQQRLAGLEAILSENKMEIGWKILSTDKDLVEVLNDKQRKQPVDVIIALGNDETEKAVDYLMADSDRKNRCLLYGEGSSEKVVYYLDREVIASLVVPNDFNMGYQSMSAIANQLMYRLSSAKSTEVDYLVINKENLYDEDNQKILFPIVQ